MSDRDIEFWFDFASPYSYPAAMKIQEHAEGRRVIWRPITLGPIFADQGWDDSPFNLQAAKGRYMWRDLARICAAEGLAFRPPDPFPANSILAARFAIAALDQPWGADFCRAVFHAEFAEHADIANPETLRELIAATGGDPVLTAEAAVCDENRPRLRSAVDEARQKGIFGAPTFVLGQELFWGFDRLDAALRWDS